MSILLTKIQTLLHKWFPNKTDDKNNFDNWFNNLIEYENGSFSTLLLYHNDGTTLEGLDIQSGVQCTIEDGWIKITTSTYREKYVYLPVCFTGADNLEISFQCKTSNYSSQAFALQMNNCGTTTYSDDFQSTSYSSNTLYTCMGASISGISASLGDNDIITFRRLNGYWFILINGVQIATQSYTWDNQRVPVFYTTNGRIQRIKNIKIRRL